MSTIHAHVETSATDCDGQYDRDYVMRPTEDEMDDYSYRFRERVMHSVLSAYAEKMSVTITNGDISYVEHTEEGYRAGDVRFCYDECPDDDHYRDHTAEAAGY